VLEKKNIKLYINERVFSKNARLEKNIASKIYPFFVS